MPASRCTRRMRDDVLPTPGTRHTALAPTGGHAGQKRYSPLADLRSPPDLGHMPTYTRYDHAARLAVVEAHGEVTRDQAVAQFRDVCAELAKQSAADRTARYGVLLDTRHAATVPTPADIVAVLDEITRHGPVLPPSRWALLAREPAHYGMGRLFSVHAEGRGIELGVFDTPDGAIAWLHAE